MSALFSIRPAHNIRTPVQTRNLRQATSPTGRPARPPCFDLQERATIDITRTHQFGIYRIRHCRKYRCRANNIKIFLPGAAADLADNMFQLPAVHVRPPVLIRRKTALRSSDVSTTVNGDSLRSNAASSESSVILRSNPGKGPCISDSQRL